MKKKKLKKQLDKLCRMAGKLDHEVAPDFAIQACHRITAIVAYNRLVGVGILSEALANFREVSLETMREIELEERAGKINENHKG